MEERRRIGELLLEAGVVSAGQLQEALEEQGRAGGRLCYNLIRLGHLTADALVGFLRDQFGVAAINLERYRVAPEVLGLLPAAFARERRIVPLHVLGRTLTVALLDPSRGDDLAAVREVTGLDPEPLICPEASLEAALRRFYPGGGDGAEGGVLELGDEAEARRLLRAEPPPEGFPAADWLRRFVLQAVRRRSREIHLEAVETGLRARFRVRGVLQDGETAPPALRREIVDLAATLGGCPPGGAALLPAQGHLRIGVRNRLLRATLSSFPTLHGERLVLKLVDEGLPAREFQELGMSKEVADEAQRLLGHRTGVVLIAAPQGQGRHTTCAGFLAHLAAAGGRNVMSLECPVRYPIAGIAQCQVGGRTGLDFATGLQSLLHQEPDVIGLMDVPDRDTLEMAFGAARRCLVVALCEARDNAQALAWVREAGISPQSQGLLLRGVLSQRLLAKLCSSCREPLAEPPRLVEGIRGRDVGELTFYTGGGCAECGGSGRSGRVAIFELLAVREELRERLLRGDPLRLVIEEAQRQGMWTLREDGLLKASQGLVDIRDAIEATSDEEAPAA
ncbi:MAG TPA: ATPase, T2SS/T4P/T4SS family [Candidatus Methanoperedens sp.]|nr:ATPase, T2SS/T4P/T4SS family [Candidatus Methanoperedens sp.]